MKELLPASAGKSIEIFLNGQAAGYVQKLTVQARRAKREAEQFAPQSGNSRRTVLGDPVYEISLYQYRPAGPYSQPDLFSLSDFTLTVKRSGFTVRYSGCEWTELKQVSEPGGVQYEVMELIARDRTQESAS